jgi:hypothetical protein
MNEDITLPIHTDNQPPDTTDFAKQITQDRNRDCIAGSGVITYYICHGLIAAIIFCALIWGEGESDEERERCRYGNYECGSWIYPWQICDKSILAWLLVKSLSFSVGACLSCLGAMCLMPSLFVPALLLVSQPFTIYGWYTIKNASDCDHTQYMFTYVMVIFCMVGDCITFCVWLLSCVMVHGGYCAERRMEKPAENDNKYVWRSRPRISPLVIQNCIKCDREFTRDMHIEVLACSHMMHRSCAEERQNICTRCKVCHICNDFIADNCKEFSCGHVLHDKCHSHLELLDAGRECPYCVACACGYYMNLKYGNNTLDCGHMMHSMCYDEWSKKYKQCPICDK